MGRKYENGARKYERTRYTSRKFHLLPNRKGERKRRWVIVWDENERRQIREIYDRKLARERPGDIAMDFYHRGEKTGEGSRG